MAELDRIAGAASDLLSAVGFRSAWSEKKRRDRVYTLLRKRGLDKDEAGALQEALRNLARRLKDS